MLKKTLLLVEDSRVQKLATEKLLLKAGYLVLTAEDGQEALQLAREAKPDLILLDMLLPKLSGEDALLALRTDPVTSRIPVLILSVLSGEAVDRMKNAGAAAYFDKSRLPEPRGPSDLVSMIQTLLEEADARNRAQRALRAASRR